MRIYVGYFSPIIQRIIKYVYLVWGLGSGDVSLCYMIT